MVIDKTGLGDPVIEQFETALKTSGIKVEGFNFAGPNKKVGLVENGVLTMEKEEISLLNNLRLKTEMLGYKRVMNEKTNKFTYDKPNGGSDDFVDSLLLCIAAHKGTVGVTGKYNVISVGTKILDTFNPVFNRNREPQGRSNNIQYRGFR